MKKGSLLLLVLGITIFATTYANAIPFTSTVQWGGISHDGVDSMEITESFTFSQTVNFSLPAGVINSVILSVTQEEDKDNGSEAWLVTASAGTALGSLSDSSHGWRTDCFTIPLALFTGVSGASWTLQVSLADSKSQVTNSIFIDKAVLSGDFTPQGVANPEPATMLLFGSGMIGLAVFGRKKFLKK
jgi:hypothetical protein